MTVVRVREERSVVGLVIELVVVSASSCDAGGLVCELSSGRSRVALDAIVTTGRR
jgi:hypothetical protein